MIYCVTGMHRSGTSLFTSYLKLCGVSMGRNLLGPGKGNIRGHFEDKDFLELHKRILVHNKSNIYVPKRHLEVPDNIVQQMKDLIGLRNEFNEVWGWKDPRTTLFLKDWDKICPGIKFIFIYRDPFEVIASLYRRMKLKYFWLRPWYAPKMYLRYNEEMLDFAGRNRDKVIFININGLNANHEKGRKVIGKWMKYELDRPYTAVYEPSDMTSKDQKKMPFPINAYMKIIKKRYGAPLESLFTKLDERALISSKF